MRGVSVSFDHTRAVQEASLDLPSGEILAVLGPSGSGKSTLLRVIAGLERPTAGTITYDGGDLTGLPTHRRGFALMFQDGQLFSHQNVAANVGYPLRIRRRPADQVRARVEELLDLVGMAGFGARRPDTLSGGERQRVALARALAVEPRLLLLDEPLSALDRELRERLAADLRRILVASRTTALLVTHDQEEAFTVADRMALMRSGRIVQQGTVEQVWAAPIDAEAARFLGYATVLTGPPAAIVLRAAGRLAGAAACEVGVALRRSALRVGDDGPLQGRVESARRGPGRTRLTVALDGVGIVDAVAENGVALEIGREVRVLVDPDRMAVLAAP